MIKSVIILTLIGIVLSKPEDLKIDPKLQQTLAKGKVANILISFNQGTSTVLQHIQSTRFESRSNLLVALNTALEENAAASQIKVTKYLDQIKTLNYKTLWITNQLYINAANQELINSLITKFSEIKHIKEELVLSLNTPKSEIPIQKNRDVIRAAEWGVAKIQAPEAVELLKNVSSNTEIRVATIDSGVRGTHESISDNYLGEYGWYDPYENSAFPNDTVGPGTHAMGTIVGKGGIGVFPDAKWMACKGCNMLTCTEQALLQCAEFLLCPTLPDGSNKNCTKAPHLINNGWGGGQGNDWFNSVITTWKTAKIIPHFSVGSGGPNCGSVRSPGDQPDVFGTGATTPEDTIYTYSSLGPAMDGRIKPDITAPGTNIRSAYYTSDTDYIELSGTTMASSHVAGLTAILLAYEPKLDFLELQQFINEGAERDSLQTGITCGNQSDIVFPNNVFGYGRINALRSLQLLIDSKK